jgi:folate-binding protein YgfZ
VPARVIPARQRRAVDFTMPSYAESTEYVCLEVRGADAATFLHAQLSLAVAALDQRAPLAGWHDARGRVRALLRVCRLPDRWWLVTPRDGAEALVKKMRMFVLRSAVTLDVAADVVVAAVLDTDAAWLARHDLPQTSAPNQVVTLGKHRLARVGADYWQVLGPATGSAALDAGLARTTPEAVALAEIGLGIPAVTAALSERFVAQMLNLDELGAVSFDKGCYPGQEIIARVHNLGGVKRRLRRYAVSAAPLPVGTPVVALDDGVPVGEVVRSAATEHGAELLAVVDNAAADAALACNDTPLHALALPFFVPRD